MAYPYLEHISTTRQTEIANFEKKFEYILEAIIPQYMKTKYPKFTEYMKVYGRFLDIHFEDIGYNLIDLYNPSDVNESVLDSLLNQYFKNVIDQNEIIITDDNKRLFIELSKIILNLKLNKNSLNFLFKNLRDYSFVDSSGNIVEVESLNIEYSENEEWWIPRQSWFDDNPTSVPYEVYPQDLQTKPFTYSFNLDNTVEAIQVLLKSVHPIGYLVEFLKKTILTEDPIYVSGLSLIDGFVINKYDNRCIYNGAIDYSGNGGAIRLGPGVTITTPSGIWVEYKTATVDFTKIDETLTNFPVLLNITDSSGFDNTDLTALFSLTGGDFKRIQIRRADGVTPLYAEVENWDIVNESSQFYIKLPSVSNIELTTFKIFYKTGIANNNYTGITGSVAAEAVWDENYLMVQHMSQDPSNSAPQIIDSTVNDNDGISINMDTNNLVYGLFSKSLTFDGINETITFGDILNSPSKFTITTVLKIVSLNGFNPFFVKGSISNNQIDYLLGTDNGELIFLYNSAGEWISVSTISANLLIDTYYNITCTISQTSVLNIEIFIDGVSVQSILLPNLLEHNNYPCYIGYDSNTLYYDGVIEDLKFSNVVRSPAYIKADNYTLRDELITMELYEVGTWTEYATITIDNSKIDEALSDFPFLLNISSVSGIGNVDLTDLFALVENDYTRLQVRAADGITALYTEVEKWDINNTTACLHTKIPIVNSVDTVIKIYYYDCPVFINEYIGITNTEIAESVWDNNFSLVQHMAQDPSDTSPQLLDSTSNNFDGTASGTMTSDDLVDSMVGKGVEFDGTDDALNLGDSVSSFGNSITISATVNLNTILLDYQGIIAKTTAQNMDYGFYIAGDEIHFQNFNGSWRTFQTTTANLIASTFYNIAVVFNIDTNIIDIFKDGIKIFSTGIVAPLLPNNSDCIIGNDNSIEFFSGILDNVRFSNIARSDAYLKAENYTLRDNLAAITFGDWVEYATITIDNTKIDTALTDFPFLLNISSTSGVANVDLTGIFTLVNLDYKRIQVRANDGTTILYTEVERWDTINNSAQLHVKIPFISNMSSTVIRLYYYDTDETHINNYIDDIATEIANNVWDADFSMVQHMAQDPSGTSPQMLDSTINNRVGESVGTMTTGDLVDSLIGKGIELDGIDDYIDFGNVNKTNGTSITISATINLNTVALDYQGVFVKSEGISMEYGFYIAADEIHFQYYNDGWFICQTDGANLLAGTFYNITVVVNIDNNTIKMYKDGTEEYSCVLLEEFSINNFSCRAGFDAGTEYFSGIIDNIRFSNSARSESHIKAADYTLRDELATIVLV